jgi:hypothetical protein
MSGHRQEIQVMEVGKHTFVVCKEQFSTQKQVVASLENGSLKL